MTSKADLDARDQLVAEWYIGYLWAHHYAPTLRETIEFAGISSTATGQAMMKRLVAKGYINGYRGKKERISA